MTTPCSTSYTPGRFTWPLMASIRVPGDFSEPNFLYASTPLRNNHGRLANVSTLLTMVGFI